MSRSPRWPFNEKTPLGFLYQSIIFGIGSFSVLIIALSGLSLLLGSCWLFISFAEDIQNDLSALNIRRRSKQNSMLAKQHLRDIVKAFSDVKELSIDILLLRTH